MLLRTLPLAALAWTCGLAAAAEPSPSPDAVAFFEKKVRPVLIASCFECHGDQGKPKGDLRVDSRQMLLKGGESGPALVPGDATTSRLIEAITYRNADLQMPPKQKLSDAAIADLTAWVKMGAPWPAEALPSTNAGADARPAVDFDARKREHWAWQPVKSHALPKVKNESWSRNDIDCFILARLEATGLPPSPPADPRTLIRRVTFDLTGLPPTPQEVEAFLKECEAERAGEQAPCPDGLNPKPDNGNALPDTHTRIPPPNAYARLVDRLLASPVYGERWARHWLDVVRYADARDSRGQGGEADFPFAYRYRDWVIDAFNRDLPYDRFVIDQIAGDLDPSRGDRPAGIIATTMLALGNWDTGDSDKRKMMTDIVDDQIDVISRGFLGTTIACARCHDHKFDPISARDYYALAGFFFSSHIIPGPGDPTAGSPMLRLPLSPPDALARIKAAQANVESIKTQINEQVDARRKEVIARELARLPQYLSAAAELHHSNQREQPGTLSAIAAKHSVHAAILKRFVRYLGMAGHGGTVPGMFTTKLSEVLGNPQVSGWGGPDTPSVLAHTGKAPVRLLTFTLPPRSIAVHPSPAKQVAIGWRSRIAGAVRIVGKAADADNAGGNGFDWSILHQRGSVTTRLAFGGAPNGGAQSFAQADAAGQLAAVAVQPGDLISIIIAARDGNHICDTTIVDLTISELAGAKRVWDLTDEVVESIRASNPHADKHGNREIWHFYAVSEADDAGPAVPVGSALAQWLAIITAPSRAPSDALTRQRLIDLAAAVARIARGPAPAAATAADAALHRDLTAPNGPLWSTIDLLAYSETAAAPLDALKARLAIEQNIAATKIEYAHGIAEGGVPGSEHAGFHHVKVHIRGRYDRLGDLVPRGFPALLGAKPQPSVVAGSGRVELARWIASEDNPLTARVMINRIWQHHFGRGLVATPDNFGHLGDRPSHPELLDYLALKFIESGWSLKTMHKLIVTSAAYQQASMQDIAMTAGPQSQTANPGLVSAAAIDPENRFLWRQNRRRLDAEQLRDAMLFAAGRIDSASGPTPGLAASGDDLSTPRRTIYLLTVRSDTSSYRILFDAADPTASIHARSESTVAPQALFMLNHPFALATADALAARLLREAGAGDQARIRWLHERLFARPARQAEVAIGISLLTAARADATVGDNAAWRQYVHVLLCSNEFMYID